MVLTVASEAPVTPVPRLVLSDIAGSGDYGVLAVRVGVDRIQIRHSGRARRLVRVAKNVEGHIRPTIKH
jgi:hypothetical protein